MWRCNLLDGLLQFLIERPSTAVNSAIIRAAPLAASRFDD
jgi:hypothetical protein